MREAYEYGERVEVQSRYIDSRDNEPEEKYRKVGDYYARVVPIRANERNSSGIEFYSEVYRFFFRKSSGTQRITNGFRLIWHGSAYNVQQSPNPGDRDEVVVLAECQSPNARDQLR